MANKTPLTSLTSPTPASVTKDVLAGAMPVTHNPRGPKQSRAVHLPTPGQKKRSTAANPLKSIKSQRLGPPKSNLRTSDFMKGT